MALSLVAKFFSKVARGAIKVAGKAGSKVIRAAPKATKVVSKVVPKAIPKTAVKIGVGAGIVGAGLAVGGWATAKGVSEIAKPFRQFKKLKNQFTTQVVGL